MPEPKQLGPIPQPQFQTQGELDSQFAGVAAKNKQMLARQTEIAKQPKVPSTTTTTPQTEAPQFDITSLRALTYHDANKVQRVKDYTAAYSSGDPSLFNDKHLKAAATKGHVNNFVSSPQFLSMKPEHQIMGLHMLYDKWVAPALQDQGVKPVTFDEWAAGVMPQADKPKGSFSQTFKTAATSALGDDVNLVANVIQKVFGQTTPEGTSAKAAERAHRYSRELKGVGNRMKAVSTSYLTQFDVPNSGSTWLANTAGMLVGQAPLFALAEATGGAGVGAIAEAAGSDIFMAEGAGSISKRITTLAERANMGGKGTETAIHAFNAGSTQYLIDRGYGKNKIESSEDAVATAILGGLLGSIFHGASKVYDSKVKDLLIKTMKRGAQKVGVGGEAMINSVADATPKLLGEGEVISPEKGAAEGKKPVTVEGERGKTADEKIVEHFNSVEVPKSKAERLQSLVHEDDPDFVNAVQHEHEMREHWARKFFPELIEHPTESSIELPRDLRGATPKYNTFDITFNDPRDKAIYIVGGKKQSLRHADYVAYLEKQFPGMSAGDFDSMKKDVLKRIKAGKIEGNVITVESVRSTPKAKVPRKVWDRIGSTKRAKVMAFMEQTQKAGAHAEALSNPKVAAAKINKDVEGMKETNPKLYQEMRQKEQEHGVSPEVAGVRAQASVEAAGLGISEIQHSLEEVFGEEDYEPLEGASATLGSRYKVSYKRNYGPSVATLADKKETSAEDFISGTIKYLEDSDYTESGHLYFESPKMHLLHLAYNTDKVPDDIVDRAKEILKKDFDVRTIKQQEYEAGWLNYHVEAMREGGHIHGGDNPGQIFQSTKLKMLRYGTTTQGKLTPELTAQFIKSIDVKIKRLDPKLATALKGFYKAMARYIERSSKPGQASARLDTMRSVEEGLKDSL